MDLNEPTKNISNEIKPVIKKNNRKKVTNNYLRSYSTAECCDNYMSPYCNCNDIEEEAGFTRDYRSFSVETAGKYVCKRCYQTSFKCECC